MASEEVNILVKIQDMASGALNGIKKGFDNLKKDSVAVGVSIFALAKTLGSFLNASAESEVATAKLNAALKNQGVVSAKVTDEILAYSASLQKQSVFTDEAITGVQTMFIGIGKHGQALKDATKLTMDFAAKTGMDLPAAGMIMTKVMNGNVSVLGRYGINVKDANGQLKPMAQVMTELKEKTSGFSDALANTPSGRLKILANQFGELQEMMGGLIATALVPVANWFLKLKDRFDQLDPGTQKLIAGAIVIGITLAGLVPIAISLATAFATAWVALTGPVGLAVVAIAALTVAYIKWRDETTKVMTMIIALNPPLRFLALVIMGVVNAFKAFFQAGSLLGGLKNIVISVAQTFLQAFKLIAQSVDFFIEKLNGIAKFMHLPPIDIGLDKAIDLSDKLNSKLEGLKDKTAVKGVSEETPPPPGKDDHGGGTDNFKEEGGAPRGKTKEADPDLEFAKMTQQELDQVELDGNARRSEAHKKAMAQKAADRKEAMNTIVGLANSENKALAAAGKAAALVQLALDAPVAMGKAFAAFPPPFNFVAAGLVGAAMAAQTASVMGVALAEGGITTGPTNALIGDNPSGIEAVIPLEKAGQMGFGGGGSLTVIFQGPVMGDPIQAREFASMIDTELYKLKQQGQSAALG